MFKATTHTLRNEAATEGDTGAGAAPEVKKAKPKKAATKKAAKKPTKASKKKAAPKKDGSVTGPAILRTYAVDYHKDKEKKTAGGNVSVDNNDDLAVKLRGKSLEDVYEMVAKKLQDKDGNPFTVKALKAKYGHLNVGMQRMNLGNRLRAA